MPPRRVTRPVSPRGSAPSARSPSWWERLPLLRRDLGLTALAALGAWGGITLLGLLWPQRDRAEPPPVEITAASLAEKPRSAVTVLVIGSDADALGASVNGAAPAGPANADALFLVRVNPRGPLQVLNVPVELAVRLPGTSAPTRLGDLYRLGGAALTADGVRELVGLPATSPERYLVLPRGALRQLVGDLGGLEVSPPRTMRYEDKAQKLKIDLQSGLQRLEAPQVEQLVRFRDKWLGEAGRRTNQQLVVASLRERLGQPEQLARLPALLDGLSGRLETNISPREARSLLAAGLDDRRPIQFASLPLSPAQPGHGELRQLDPKAKGLLWKAP